MRIWAVFRRELLGYFLSPLAYVVLIAFLLVNGYLFYGILRYLADPAGPGGAPMQLLFGGSLLYWLVQLFFLSSITMRLFAEEARTGALETLLSTPVSEGELALGKYAAALCFYLFLWAPTLLYVVLIEALGDAPQDPGPIAAGYLGVLVAGALFLALGLFTSALTRSQIVAAVLALALSAISISAGLFSSFALDESWRRLLAHLDLFGRLGDFGRGIVDTRALVYTLSGAAFFVFAAARVLTVRRLGAETGLGGWLRGLWLALRGAPGGAWRGEPPRRAAQVGLELLSLLAALLLVLCVNYLASRHPQRLDWTRSGFYSLSEESRARLQDLPPGLALFVLCTADDPQAGSVFPDIQELVTQLEDASGGALQVEYIDPFANRTRAEAVLDQYQLPAVTDLNLLLFANPALGRSRALFLDDLVDFDYSPEAAQGAPRAKRFKGEAASIAALLGLSSPAQKKIRITTGHGEAAPGQDPRPITAFAEALRDEGHELAPLALTGPASIPAETDLVIVAGPSAPFSREEERALLDYLDQGGSVLLALDPEPARDTDTLAPTGLEGLLGRWGVALGDDVVFDPDPRGHLPADDSVYSYALLAIARLGEHPVTRSLSGLLVAMPSARSVRAVESKGRRAVELLYSSEDAWGERNLSPRALPQPDKADSQGPLPVAVATEDLGEARGRLLVLGSSSGLLDVYMGGPAQRNPGNFQLALNLSRWLLSQDALIALPPKTPERVRVVMSASAERTVLWILLGGLPLVGALLGLAVWQARRR